VNGKNGVYIYIYIGVERGPHHVCRASKCGSAPPPLDLYINKSIAVSSETTSKKKTQSRNVKKRNPQEKERCVWVFETKVAKKKKKKKKLIELLLLQKKKGGGMDRTEHDQERKEGVFNVSVKTTRRYINI